jgi:RNA polymerase sigma-70 factor (ECF subfamily)
MEYFKSIVEEYYPIFYKIARSFTRNSADFEDLYQEILIQVYQSLKNFREESKQSTWIYKVALNTAMTYSRGNKKKRREVETDDMASHDRGSQTDGPEKKEEEERKIEMLYESINKLNKDDRAMILLHLEGKQYDEIAEIMGISKSNTGVKLMRIRKRLQSILISKGYERN